ncbi:MAG: ABC transporter permease [Pseudonocardiales bacterium]
MTAPLTTDPSAQSANPEAILAGQSAKRIEGRSLGQIAWLRLKRDRVAMVSLGLVILFLLVAILADVLAGIEGQNPLKFNPGTLDLDKGALPRGSFGGVSADHWLGVEPSTGRDLFARLVFGARTSLIVALTSTALSVGLGSLLGVMAGFFGGKIDSLISRGMDLILAFPQLLLLIALTPVAIDRLATIGIGGSAAHLVYLIGVIGFFGWPYFGRIIRGQTLSLREREFVDASRSLGATNSHILFKQLLPNLVAPILVYSTLIIPTYISLEAALSYLGVGVIEPTPSWGKMLNDSVTYSYADPTYLMIPGVALFALVLAFNLFGDGLRDALDPKAGR